MASIYRRENCNSYWVKFRDPLFKREYRLSLETNYEEEARCKLRKIELLCALRRPEVTITQLPDRIEDLIGSTLPPPAEAKGIETHSVSDEAPQLVSSPQPPPEVAPVPIVYALGEYYRFIRAENGDRTVQNKLSILRKFFGGALVAEITGIRPREATMDMKPFFTGRSVQEMTPDTVQEFIESGELKTKTRRHYRELFHHFFEFLLRRHMLEPRSWHTPNVLSALPSYTEKNQMIVYMSDTEIEKQLRLLEPQPTLRMAALIMIETGVRRDEAMWLTTDAIGKDCQFLSVVNRLDPESDPDSAQQASSLKTGARSVTISTRLREELQAYLPKVHGRWLLPSPRGKRWNKDNFSRTLRKTNKAAGLTWGPLIYRHTFATRRAMVDGWSSVRIAREMGNSVTMVDRYYAGFLRPDAI